MVNFNTGFEKQMISEHLRSDPAQLEKNGDEVVVLMQRRKRGRFSMPRRRRRERASDAAKRAANRERWTRGAPSRAPPPSRRHTSATRPFPKAPWTRPAAKVDDEVEVCVEEPENEGAAPPRLGVRPFLVWTTWTRESVGGRIS